MKKLLSLMLVLALLMSMLAIGTVNASAAFGKINSTDAFVVIGDAKLCGSSWDVNNTDNAMTYNEAKGVFEKIYYDVPDGIHNFKIVNTTTGEHYATHGKISADSEKNAEFKGGEYRYTISFDGAKAQIEALTFFEVELLEKIANGEPLEPMWYPSDNMVLTLGNPVKVYMPNPNSINGICDDEVDMYFTPSVSGIYTLNVDGSHSYCSLYNCESSEKVADKNGTTYSLTYNLKAGTQYCYEIYELVGGANYTKVTLTLDEETSEGQDDFYIVAGDKWLCGSQWDPKDPRNALEWNEEKGIYEKAYYNVAKGEYQFKITTNGEWDYGDYNLEGNASYGGRNAVFYVEDDGSDVIIGFDGSKALVWVFSPKDPSGDIPTEEIPEDPTQPEGEKGATIVVGGVETKASVGDIYTYYYYLNASNVSNDGLLINMQATTYFDGSVIKVLNYEEDFESKNRRDMFPILYKKDGTFSQPMSKLEENTLNFNATNFSGYYFNSDRSVLVKITFEIIGEGASNVATIVENSCDMDFNDIVFDSGFVGDRWNYSEVLEAVYVKPTEDPSEEPSEETSETPSSEEPSEETSETPSSEEPSEETSETPSSEEPSEETSETPSSEEPSEETSETPSSEEPSEETSETPSSEEPSEETSETPSSEEPSEETSETPSSEDTSEDTSEDSSEDTTEKEVILGDVDNSGEITILDVTAIQRMLAKISTFTDSQIEAGDTNKDGEVDILDATTIQRLLAKKITEF